MPVAVIGVIGIVASKLVDAYHRPAIVIAVEGDATASVQDVLVGEVWLCSGQSNMEWTMKGTLKPDQFAAINPTADDALVLDTDNLSEEQVLARILEMCKE